MNSSGSTSTGTGKKTISGMDVINGVSCDVSNCKYHGASNCCGAEKISVENESALRKAETFCSTFAPRAQ